MTAPVRVFVVEAGDRQPALTHGVRRVIEALDVEIVEQVEAAGAMVVIRTGVSESAAFQIAHNAFGGPRLPMFFALWKQAPAAPPEWRELGRLCRIGQGKFDRPQQVRGSLAMFLGHIDGASRRREKRMIRLMEQLVA
jgi:hypothetical protein